ncbi:hypothetical protein HOLleu_41968 [Holothuria leucospilota]|uniref:Uncharacterized protein n=1 Tax=Holothuria leucospilota TaxID=206669 RepID=A0A9Q0YEN6_HOLLE|nr:hypothetical protein HOLleu_41968 [Holothuria leucospilota]
MESIVKVELESAYSYSDISEKEINDYITIKAEPEDSQIDVIQENGDELIQSGEENGGHGEMIDVVVKIEDDDQPEEEHQTVDDATTHSIAASMVQGGDVQCSHVLNQMPTKNGGCPPEKEYFCPMSCVRESTIRIESTWSMQCKGLT